jgi:hypothetical protein
VNDEMTRKIGKLLAQSEKAGTEAEAEVFLAKAQGVTTSAELVLVGRRDEVVRFYENKLKGVRGKWRGNQRSSHSSHAAEAGDRAGRQARVGASTAIGGQRAAISA